MAKDGYKLGVTLIVITISFMSSPGDSVSYCYDACQSLDDCDDQLICISGKCYDDPEVGTDVCRGSGGGGGGGGASSTGSCQQVGTLKCQGRSYPAYDCSPPVTNATMAKLTFSHFSEGGSTSKCDGKAYSNEELVVAVSTGWYDNGSRCLKKLRITAGNGRSVVARVVDECDSLNGCDEGHGQPPCPNDIVDGSKAVWEALRLNQDEGIVDIIWSMA